MRNFSNLWATTIRRGGKYLNAHFHTRQNDNRDMEMRPCMSTEEEELEIIATPTVVCHDATAM